MDIPSLLNEYYTQVPQYNCDVAVPDAYNPEKWITTEETIKSDFARYIQFLLTEVDSGSITYSDMFEFVHSYATRSFRNGILLGEIKKTDLFFRSFYLCSYYKIDEIGADQVGISREFIELSVDLFLNPEHIEPVYDALTSCSWEHLRISGLIKHPAIANYLERALNFPDSYSCLDKIILNLGFQESDVLMDTIEWVLYPDFPVLSGWHKNNEEIQRAAIHYMGNFENKESAALLSELRASESLFTENEEVLEVVLAKVRHGEEGLLSLFDGTDSSAVKVEIIKYYPEYQTKAFAQRLLSSLTDDFKLPNGYYVVRCTAKNILKMEQYAKLLEWFGEEVISQIENTVCNAV